VLVQYLLVCVALVLVALLLYSFYASASAPSGTPLQVALAVGVILAMVAAVILFYTQPPEKRPGEQVSY
jgi:hypothetical protein